MTTLVRQTLFLAVAAALSWWFFLYEPVEVNRALPSLAAAAPVSVVPRTRTPEPKPENTPAPAAPTPAPQPAPEVESPPRPEPIEAPVEEPVEEPIQEQEPEEPEPDPEPAAETSPPPAPERGSPDAGGEAPAKDLMQNSDLVEQARRELSGEERTGFSTVLVATPEDQLAIARYFGEEVLLVPKAALDPDAEGARWFRVDLSDAAAPVRTETGAPPLDGFRQYRDLFAYEYERLPPPLRRLRRSVLSRADVFVFAALIPPAEWAVVVGRRRAALALSGREAADVERYVLRYVHRPDAAFDLEVREIVFADGTRFFPTKDRKGG
ncbi:MAG: hypothetical protein GY711_11555 [bacterium]|nr:hypothetical protein [bacterium]